MDELIKAKSEYSDILASMAAFDTSSENFDAEGFQKLQNDKKALQARIAQLEAKQEADALAQTQQAAANTVLDSLAPAAPTTTNPNQTSHVTNVRSAFDDLDGMGYECAGELLADHVAVEMWGKMPNDSSDGFRLKRYQNYINAQGINHAAGTASTLVDGLEIIPEIMPGIKEYGQGEGVNEVLSAFRPERTSVPKELGYYFNEDTYNRDGLVVTRIQEGGQITPQQFSNKFGRVRLHKVGIFSKITEEDLQNVPLLESRYMMRAPETIDTQKVEDIISGTGVGQPVGFTNAANTARVTVTRDTASQISYNDLANMEKQYFRKNGNGLYFTNQSTLAQLMNITDNSGALLWRSSRNDGLFGSLIHGTLNGRPLVVSEDMPALGSTGDLALVNPAGYIFAEHTSGIRFAQSMHFYFDADAMAFRWLSQYGGQNVFDKSYTPRKGGENLSHFVLLDAAVTT